jgi:hypothetical protein
MSVMVPDSFELDLLHPEKAATASKAAIRV